MRPVGRNEQGIRRPPAYRWGGSGGPSIHLQAELPPALAWRPPEDSVFWPAVAVCLAVAGLLVAVVAGCWQTRRLTSSSAWVFVENRGGQTLHVSVADAAPVAVAPGRHASFTCRPGNQHVQAECGGEYLLDGTRYLGEGSINYFVLVPPGAARHP
jgi:hypothetical protein